MGNYKDEIWKDIPEYEGLYQVSNYGRVRSIDRNIYRNGGCAAIKGKMLVLRKKNSGYMQVNLWKDNKGSNFYIHRLVAQSFIPNPENKPEVDHIDTNVGNNHVNNLRWVTSRENHLNPITYKKSCLFFNKYKPNKGKFGFDNPTSKTVLQFDINDNFIKEWGSTREIERELGIKPCCISAVALGIRKRKTAGGYKWKYK